MSGSFFKMKKGNNMENELFCGAKWICPKEFENIEPINIFHREHDGIVIPQLDSMMNVHYTVRKCFQVNKRGKYILRITGDDYYKAYINGRFVGQGPCQGYYFNYYWNEFDVTDFIEDGQNTITVNVYYHGALSHAYLTGDRKTGVLCCITGGKNFSVVSDGSWECSLMPEFCGNKLGGYRTLFFEDIDLTKRTRDYKPAAERDYDVTLSPEPAKALSVYTVQPKTTELLDGGYIFCDFGTEITGTLRIRVNGARGSKVIVYTGEETDDSPMKTRYNMRCNTPSEETFTLCGENDEYEQYDYKGFRYVTLLPEAGVEIEKFEAIVRHYPFDDSYCELETDDEILKSVWTICKNGVKYGSQEIFVDCPTREKGQYSGDMTVTSGAHMILTGDASLTRKAIDNFIQSEFIDDGLMAVAPSSIMQEIADYSLQFPIWAIRYYEFTKDRAYLEKCLEVAEKIHCHFRKYEREDGLLDGVSDKWNLVDWPVNLRDNYDFPMTKPIGKGCHNVMNAFYAGFVKQTDEMRILLGKEPTNEYKRLQKAFNDEFYNSETKLYVDAKGSDHSSLHSNILPFYYGICPEESIVPIKELMMEKKLCCGVYMSFFFLKGLLRYGFRDEAYSILTLQDEHCWYNMVREGATTCFEAWGKDQKGNCSLCHPWASSPIEIINDLGLLEKH